MKSYKKNYLTQVIFQMHFTPLDQLKINIDQQFSDLCTGKTNAPSLVNNNINLTISEGQVLSEKTNTWNFTNDNFRIVVTHNVLQIIASKYTTHEDFHSLITDITSSFIDLYKPHIMRIGVRYINMILFNGEAYDFNDYINKDLLASTLAYKNDFALTRSIGNMIMKDEESDLVLGFVYGWINSIFPNKIAKREFLLDYECAKENINGASVSVKDIIKQIRNFVNKVFENSITEGLREEMNK